MSPAHQPIYLIKPEHPLDRYVLAPPLGILYLASALEKRGFTVRLVHRRLSAVDEKNLAEEIIEARPLFVGLSTFTSSSLLPALGLSRQVKARSSIPVVWGGLHSTMLPEQTLAEPAIDIVCRGEGEETVARLAEALASGPDWRAALSAIPGLAYREDGQVRMTPLPPFIQNLDAFEPAWHLLGIDRYIQAGKSIYSNLGSKLAETRVATVMTSRGCPGRCGYCYNQFVNRRSFRAHSVEFVACHVESLKRNHGVAGIVFEDDCLFTDRKRALEIFRRIGLPWTSSIRADFLSRWGEDFARELKDLGCAELRIGAESGSDTTLALMAKDINRDDIIRSAEICRTLGIHLLMGFMIGVPGECWAEMKKTFDLIDEMEKMGVTVAAGPAFYFPYPGTPMYGEAVRAGFKPPASIEAWATAWGPSQPKSPYADKRARYIGAYRSLAMNKEADAVRFPWLFRGLRAISRFRWRHRWFSVPLDYHLPRAVLRGLRRVGLSKLASEVFS